MNRYKVIGVLLVALLAACQSDALEPNPNGTDLSPQATLEGTYGVAGSATGSAHVTVFPPSVPHGLALRNFAFSAVKRGDGSTMGEWQIVAGGTILHGPIDCLTIAPDGESARISGLVSSAKFSPTFEEGTAFAMELFDNGAGGSSDADVTTNLRAFRNMAPEVGRAFCETGATPPGVDLDPLPTEHGNLTIRLAE